MPMNWNDKADVRLFINVLKIHNVKLDYAALAESMGAGVTAKAITHRIAKLRSIAAAEEHDHPSGTASTPRKPRGSKQNGDKSGSPTGRKRTSRDMDAERDDDEVGNGGGSFKAEEEEPVGKRFKTESAGDTEEVEEVLKGEGWAENGFVMV